MRTPLSPQQINDALLALSHWHLSADERSVEADLSFSSFSEAFAFMTRVALVAEQLDHHPDWSNSYRKVHIALTTHAQGGVTALDVEMATRIEALL